LTLSSHPLSSILTTAHNSTIVVAKIRPFLSHTPYSTTFGNYDGITSFQAEIWIAQLEEWPPIYTFSMLTDTATHILCPIFN